MLKFQVRKRQNISPAPSNSNSRSIYDNFNNYDNNNNNENLNDNLNCNLNNYNGNCCGGIMINCSDGGSESGSSGGSSSGSMGYTSARPTTRPTTPRMTINGALVQCANDLNGAMIMNERNINDFGYIDSPTPAENEDRTLLNVNDSGKPNENKLKSGGESHAEDFLLRIYGADSGLGSTSLTSASSSASLASGERPSAMLDDKTLNHSNFYHSSHHRHHAAQLNYPLPRHRTVISLSDERTESNPNIVVNEDGDRSPKYENHFRNEAPEKPMRGLSTSLSTIVKIPSQDENENECADKCENLASHLCLKQVLSPIRESRSPPSLPSQRRQSATGILARQIHSAVPSNYSKSLTPPIPPKPSSQTLARHNNQLRAAASAQSIALPFIDEYSVRTATTSTHAISDADGGKSVQISPRRQIFTEKLANFEAQKSPTKLNQLANSKASTIFAHDDTVNLKREKLKDRRSSRPETCFNSIRPKRVDGKYSLAGQFNYGTIRPTSTAVSAATTAHSRLSLLFSNMSAHHRSNSLGSLSSLDSGESATDWGYLRVFTGAVKVETDYVTLKISGHTSTRAVITRLLNKLRMTASRDLNLFQLWMEVRTKMYDGSDVKSVLELDKESRPLELQRCHPADMSRFVLATAGDACLLRIFDGTICPQSNYKSLLISRRTTCAEVLQILLRMCRVAPFSINSSAAVAKNVKSDAAGYTGEKNERTMAFVGVIDDDPTAAVAAAAAIEDRLIDEYALFVEGTEGSRSRWDESAQIADNCALADVYLRLAPQQRIALRHRANQEDHLHYGGGEIERRR